MFRRTGVIATVAFILLMAVALIARGYVFNRVPKVEFDLPDGSTIKLLDMQMGRSFKFYEGKLWQKMLNELCHTNLPQRYRGREVEFVTSETNDTIVLQFEQDFGRRGFLTSDALRSQMLLQMVDANNKTECKMVDRNLHWAIVARRCRTYDRTFYWECPVKKEQKLCFYLSCSDTNSHTSVTNLFTIKNAAFN